MRTFRKNRSTRGPLAAAGSISYVSMKLLVVEDEQNLRELILRYLRKEGFLSEWADNLKDAYRKAINHEYDCVILDLNLPDGDGLKLVKVLRENRTSAGIVIISARDTIDDRIQGLDLGADDYLIKPFNLSELNARVKAVIRRKAQQFSEVLDFGELKLRVDSREVLAGEQLLKLTKKEFDILVYLARNKNRVVTKDSIAEYLWGDYMDEAVSFDFIYAHVKNLRKKLADHGCGDYLKTVYGIGYKFVAN